MKVMVLSNGTLVETIDVNPGYTVEDYKRDCETNGWEFAPCDADDNIEFEVSEEEKEIAILMEDHCTRNEAEKHLWNGTVVYDNATDYFQSLIDCDCYNGETEDDIRKGKVPDVSMVEFDGHEYVIAYCL